TRSSPARDDSFSAADPSRGGTPAGGYSDPTWPSPGTTRGRPRGPPNGHPRGDVVGVPGDILVAASGEDHMAVVTSRYGRNGPTSARSASVRCMTSVWRGGGGGGRREAGGGEG